ncbi:hypothetical protein AAY473_035863 [Plecturocebus cupreus]
MDAICNQRRNAPVSLTFDGDSRTYMMKGFINVESRHFYFTFGKRNDPEGYYGLSASDFQAELSQKAFFTQRPLNGHAMMWKRRDAASCSLLRPMDAFTLISDFSSNCSPVRTQSHVQPQDPAGGAQKPRQSCGCPTPTKNNKNELSKNKADPRFTTGGKSPFRSRRAAEALCEVPNYNVWKCLDVQAEVCGGGEPRKDQKEEGGQRHRADGQIETKHTIILGPPYCEEAQGSHLKSHVEKEKRLASFLLFKPSHRKQDTVSKLECCCYRQQLLLYMADTIPVTQNQHLGDVETRDDRFPLGGLGFQPVLHAQVLLGISPGSSGQVLQNVARHRSVSITWEHLLCIELEHAGERSKMAN